MAKGEASLISATLTDTQWSLMAPHCLGREGDPGRTGLDPRRFVEAVLWIARTGCPRRDLPETSGQVELGLQALPPMGEGGRMVRALAEDAMIDGRIVKVHRHGQGAKGGLRARPSGAPGTA